MRVKTDFAAARKLIEAAGNIVVVSHIHPDGDAVGSLLSISLALQASGRSVSPVLADGLPGMYDFVPGAELVKKEMPANWDLVICVDCADVDRTGLPAEVFKDKPVINVDHHPTNTEFGEVNCVNPAAAATVEILYDLILMLQLPLDHSVRTHLLIGLLADTIGFRTSNVHPGSLRMAADLFDKGADLPGLYDRILNKRSFSAVKYWGYGLQKVQRNHQVVWTSLSLVDRKSSGYQNSDDADLINVLSTIDDSLVTILFVEQPGGKVKVSWRARPGVDVAELAGKFGGGGHKPAAGASLTGMLDEIEKKIVSETTRFVENIKG
jgi:bifunctional oligoribonuclease and PAP phosphatase NrnA